MLSKWTLALCWLITANLAIADINWKVIRPGLEVTTIDSGKLQLNSRVIAFRIDPKHFRFSLKMANQTAYVDTLGKEANALIAINGGYFSKQLTPLGLRISNGKLLAKAKPISWWGIFYLRNKKPSISSTRNFQLKRKINFAIQAGPRLVVHNKIPSLKPGIAERSAVAITKADKVILAVTQNNAISLQEWAKILKTQLQCKNALNLDGGSSSQLYSVEGYNVSNYKPVTDAIVVNDRS